MNFHASDRGQSQQYLSKCSVNAMGQFLRQTILNPKKQVRHCWIYFNSQTNVERSIFSLIKNAEIKQFDTMYEKI